MTTVEGLFESVETLPRGRHGLTREQVIASQRGRLLAGMAEAVAEKGYARTTVADVTSRAGVSSKTFYQQFPDKESCFLAAYDVCVKGLLETITEGLGSADEPPLERCERAIGAYLDELAANPSLARTFLIEVHAAGPEALDRRREVQARFAEMLALMLGPSVPPEGREELSFACEAFIGALSFLITTRIVAGETDQLRQLRRPLTRLVERQLTALGAE
jgi:AcrR family transcriptional regulator